MIMQGEGGVDVAVRFPSGVSGGGAREEEEEGDPPKGFANLFEFILLLAVCDVDLGVTRGADDAVPEDYAVCWLWREGEGGQESAQRRERRDGEKGRRGADARIWESSSLLLGRRILVSCSS